MQRHESSFVIEATPAEVWSVWWPPAPPLQPGEIEIKQVGDVRIEILHQGDEHHNGLVRHCYYAVPKYLLSRGVAESWELVSDVVPKVSCRYRAVTTPPFAIAEGFQRLDDLGDGRTRVTFIETYAIRNPLLRLLERPLHRFISRDNDKFISAAIHRGVAAMRAASAPHRAPAGAPEPSWKPAQGSA